ncbi:phosphate acyltransferase [Alicyclobacillus contaminans]|uniref:phosphate acyltransferase PlsX n=1 Tax=Alicyclobacillus contaminans TaxID=392016 RepID=UPI00041AD6AC|nr:phosphate acyltransferase PlsX [Alicyclobacillus contaminans]GMA49088.1 phosphate acyltransferase [Alicyclobacillus contaminans]
MRIAIDAMGGDHAPMAPVQGASAFAEERPDVEVLLIGDEAQIRQVRALPANVRVEHTVSVVEPGEEPVRAVRRKPDSSLVTAARMVKEGAADAMVSAGNTGALVAAGLLVVGRLEGIDRPALAPVLPTFDGRGVMLLDAGATMDANSRHLLQFALMGSAYSKYVLGVERPRVGLLNVGTEEGKGNAVVKDTYGVLKAFEQIHFAGNVEARDLLSGSVDVVVCDGFVGNVVLKLVEGVGAGVFGALKEAFLKNWWTKLRAAAIAPTLRPFRRRFDYAEYGGAPFLGVAGGCFKAHGSSNARAWYVTCTQAARFVENRLLNHIAEDLQSDRTEAEELGRNER